MEQVSVKELLEAGVHFGHQTHRWNPKMRPYIFTQRGGVHIIDLAQTEKQLKEAIKLVGDTVALGGHVLFVGTKQQAKSVIEEEAIKVKQPFVSNRWLGGMLTNYKTIKQSIDRLLKLVSARDGGQFDNMSKKEVLGNNREIAKLEKNLSGIKDMNGLPGVLFIVDPKKEEIACKEARKLKIPVIAICDTNCDPDGVDYLIAGNDDAIRSISLITKAIAESCLDGSVRREEAVRNQSKKEAAEKIETKKAGPTVVEKKMGGRGKAYVGRIEGAGATAEDVEKFASATAEKKEEVKPEEKKEMTTE